MVKFAKAAKLLKPSEIRELLKITSQPGFISFAGGMPAPELFPVEDLMEAHKAVMEEQKSLAMQYSATEGIPRLREQIAARMFAKTGAKVAPESIIMTSGSQQGLDFSARIFIDPGDVIVLEAPSYLGAINAFKVSQPDFVEIPTDEDGMIMEELEKVLSTNDRVRMIYVIPDFQNPTGRTWPLERRKKFIEIINKFQIPVIEDNPYGELRYQGEAQPSLKSLDTEGLVVHLGSFSKILAPGYRLGWVCASPEILQKYTFLAQAGAIQSSTVAQMEISKYMDMFDLDAHVDKICKTYAHRCDLMLSTMDKTFPKECSFSRPRGGLFTWVTCPDYINTKVLAEQALAQKVAYIPGSGFFPTQGHDNYLRLNYSCMPDEKIIEGVTKLGEILTKNMR